MVRAGVIAASVVLVMPLGSAFAGPTRKVTIESDPPGAHVYLNEKEDGVVCEATPCTIDAPLGETPLIVEIDGYAPSITMLDVAKGRGPLKQTIKLVAAGGGIDAKAWPGPKPATVKVDDEDKGLAPIKIPVSPGTRHVQYFVDGKQVYEEYIDVEAGGDYYDFKPKASSTPPGPPPKDDGANPLDEPSGGEVHKDAPEKPRDPILTASLLLDIGFRQYSYSNPRTSDLRSESEGGQVLAGPLIELYPTSILAPGHLKGLALVGRFEFGLKNNTIPTGDGITMPITTFWQSIEVSVRNRWMIGDTASVDASVGYVGDRLQFNGDVDDIKLLPDSDYSSIRFGARGALLLGSVEPFLEAENRVVLSAGEVSGRFGTASSNGIHAELGVVIRSGKLNVRLAGELTRYSSTYSLDGMPATTKSDADGSTDVVEVLEVGAGYSY
jgi:hypothetical protein